MSWHTIGTLRLIKILPQIIKDMSLRKSELRTKEDSLTCIWVRDYFLNKVIEVHSIRVCSKKNIFRNCIHTVLSEYKNTVYEEMIPDNESIPIPYKYPAIKTWLDNHNLSAKWCYKWMVEYIDKLAFGGEDIEGISFPISFLTEPYSQLRSPDGCSNYYPLLETRKEYIERHNTIIEEIFKNNPILLLGKTATRNNYKDSILTAINNYCIKVERWFESQSIYRENNIKIEIQWIEWAVAFQIFEDSFSSIASRSSFSISKVQRNIEAILKLIQLPKHTHNKPGRPRGSKSSPTNQILRKLGR
jgi:hypothetical protein